MCFVFREFWVFFSTSLPLLHLYVKHRFVYVSGFMLHISCLALSCVYVNSWACWKWHLIPNVYLYVDGLTIKRVTGKMMLAIATQCRYTNIDYQSQR